MPSHFVFAAMMTWGHLRPQVALALNLLESYPDLYITLLVHVSSIPKLDGEIANFGSSEPVKARLKIDTVGTVLTDGSPVAGMMQLGKELPLYFKRQLKVWAVDAEGFNARPTLVCADQFLTTASAGLKDACAEQAISPAIPFLIFHPVNVAFHLLYNAPGGIVDAMTKQINQFKQDNPNETPDMAFLRNAYIHSEGRLLNHIPGFEPMYDYEYLPQQDATDVQAVIGVLIMEFAKNAKLSQGLVLTFSPDLEPAGLGKKAEEIFGRQVIQVGPQMSPKVWAGDFSSGKFTSSEQECLDFLDASEFKYGKNSVLYISFGSFYFPAKRPDLIFTLLESLAAAEPPVPFLFAMAGASPELAKELGEWVGKNAGGFGKVSSWTPQMRVLQHPGTGWFLTHGGSNSASESVLSSVPMIFWPVTGDQPTIASEMTLTFKISYELMQVRNGPSVGKPTYRGVTPRGTKEALTAELTELWKTVRGPHGAATRERAEAASATIRKSRESGLAKEGMQKFEKYMSR